MEENKDFLTDELAKACLTVLVQVNIWTLGDQTIAEKAINDIIDFDVIAKPDAFLKTIEEEIDYEPSLPIIKKAPKAFKKAFGQTVLAALEVAGKKNEAINKMREWAAEL